MARAAGNLGGLQGLGKLTEVRQRLMFVLLAIIVFRIGTHITIPGIDQAALAEMFRQQQGTILASSRWASCPTSRPPSSCSC